jgi:antitoxin HicB
VNYAVVLDKNKDGCWTAVCPLLPGCISEGRTRAEALKNIRCAIRLYLRCVRKEIAILERRGKLIAKVRA